MLKKIIISTFLVITSFLNSSAQNIIGDWYGALDINGIKLNLVIHIKKSDGKYLGSFDSPKEKAFDIPLSKVSFKQDTLTFFKSEIGLSYTGKLENDIITGVFKQAGMEFPLQFSRKETNVKTNKPKRPQEPKAPFPYITNEVQFNNEEIKLAGTLSLPKGIGPFPAVILISGSGPQNRDEELMGHKPFLVLADHLTKEGFAVLRYDDRGTANSEGNFKTATSADFAKDVLAAKTFLSAHPKIKHSQIGLLGHSEGGMIAPMLAAKDKDIAFIVMLAGPGIKISELMLLQQQKIAESMQMAREDIAESQKETKIVFDIIANEKDNIKATQMVSDYIDKELAKLDADEVPRGLTKKEHKEQQMAALSNPWMLYFLRYDPTPALQKTTCPTLAINGEKDIQVLPKENLNGIKQAMKKNKQLTIIELKGLNHLFQKCKTCTIDEYANIEQTIAPEVLDIISQWLKKQTK